MLVYRISKKAYIQDLSGRGAALYGGRWNPKGISLCYTAGTISLAYLEFLVHNYHILNTATICLAKIRISDSHISALKAEELPDGWRSKNIISHDSQKVGKDFVLKNEFYAMKLPSVIVPGEYNYLLNPLHKDHSATSIEEIIDPLQFDSRLLDLVK
ncbi:MAG: RES family NAD+ phosphorylase [Cyclobacteriaceae bacterium]